MSKSWIVEVEQATDGEYFIQLTDEMLEESGFKIGDEFDWKDNNDGSWTLIKKQPEKEWVLVECVSQFRMRYVVEVPKGKAEWAMDTVVMNEAKEFSQEHIGESIVSHRVISREDALKLCDIDNNYCSSWDDDKKVEVFFTEEGYVPPKDY